MTRKTMWLASAALSFALAAGAAQAQTTMQKSGQAQSQTADRASRSFITNAIESNIAEINVGKLAQEKGKSDAVKNFGKMLVDDHTAANEKAIAAARDLGVTPPSGSSLS